MQLLNAEGFNNAALQRIAGLGAEPADAVGGVVAAQGGQVHTGDGAKQPCRLGFLFYGAPGYLSCRAPLDGAGVDAHAFNPIQVERDAAVGFESAAVEDDRDGLDDIRRGVGRAVVRGDGLDGHGVTPQKSSISEKDGLSPVQVEEP